VKQCIVTVSSDMPYNIDYSTRLNDTPTYGWLPKRLQNVIHI